MTTCSPVFCQDPPVIVTESASPPQLQSFRKALLTAAEEAFKAKEISRMDLFKIRIASLNKNALEKMYVAVAEQAAFEGKAEVATLATLDWQTLVWFIKDILPIILQLINLFS